MKFYIAFILFCHLSCASQDSQKPKLACSDVHAGNFTKMDEIFGIYKISRTKNDKNQVIQIEEVVKSKLKIEFLVTWTSDCICEIRFSKVLENGIGYDFETMLKDVVRTEKIFEIKRDSTQAITEYKIKATSNQNKEEREEIFTVDSGM